MTLDDRVVATGATTPGVFSRSGRTFAKSSLIPIPAPAFHADLGLDDVRNCLRDGAYPMVGIERCFCGYSR